jgi:hypothetical protein
MNVSQSIKRSFSKTTLNLKQRKGMGYLLVIVLALVAFEAFNFSTTDFALSDLLGDLRFMGIRWATLLALAFCAIDFAGIARLFTPQTDEDEPRSTWFMFGAWILAATMNAILTWWGVVMAMQTHSVLSASIMESSSLGKVVPIFIALMVWVIRIMLIGTLSKQGDRLLHGGKEQAPQGMSQREFRQAQSRAAHPKAPRSSVPVGMSRASVAKAKAKKGGRRPEPSYVPMQDTNAYHAYKASGTRR